MPLLNPGEGGFIVVYLIDSAGKSPYNNALAGEPGEIKDAQMISAGLSSVDNFLHDGLNLGDSDWARLEKKRENDYTLISLFEKNRLEDEGSLTSVLILKDVELTSLGEKYLNGFNKSLVDYFKDCYQGAEDARAMDWRPITSFINDSLIDCKAKLCSDYYKRLITDSLADELNAKEVIHLFKRRSTRKKLEVLDDYLINALVDGLSSGKRELINNRVRFELEKLDYFEHVFKRVNKEYESALKLFKVEPVDFFSFKEENPIPVDDSFKSMLAKSS